MLVVGGCTSHGPVEATGRAGEAARAGAIAEQQESVGQIGDELSMFSAEELARARNFEGIFDIDRLAGGKDFQGSWLELEDGRRYVLSYRPMPAHVDKVERRVVVRGFTYAPEGQRIRSEHLQVISMRLADGETPYVSPPTSLPAPPHVLTRAELRARVGRWVQAVGTLKDAKRPDADGWQEVELRLDDGAAVSTIERESLVERIYRPNFGARVTLIGELSQRDGAFVLVGTTGLCVGEVEGCGTTTPALH